MRNILVLTVFVVFASFAHADSVPTYNMISGTVTLTNITVGSSLDTFSFSNGSGVNIGGQDTFPPISMNLVGGGSTGNPFLSLGFNLQASNVNGTGLFLFGSFTITGADFILPTSGSTFSTTIPVLFSGSFRSCQGTFGPFGGCNPPPTFLGQFNINGPGTVSLNFLGIPLEGGSEVWQLAGATYTLNAVPEPTSAVLLGTGMLVVFGKLRRRKNG